MQSLPMCIVGGIAVGVFERIVLAQRRLARPVDRRPLPVRRRAGARHGRRAQPPRRHRLVAVGPGQADPGTAAVALVRAPPAAARLHRAVRLLRDPPALPARSSRSSSSGPRSSSTRWSRSSITPLAGWAGQLSLGQFAFVGLGVADDGRAARRSRHPGAVQPLRTCRSRWRGSRPSSARPLVGVFAAIIIGIPALRARGLFLAVITLAFAVMCSNWLFRLPLFTGSRVRHHHAAHRAAGDRSASTSPTGAASTTCATRCSSSRRSSSPGCAARASAAR